MGATRQLIGLKYFRAYRQNGELLTNLRKFAPNLIWITIPLPFLYCFIKHLKPIGETEVVVLQPNIDPYEGKYQRSNIELLALAEELTQNQIQPTTEYLTPNLPRRRLWT